LAKQTIASTTNLLQRAFAEPYLRTMEKRLEALKALAKEAKPASPANAEKPKPPAH
jgi:hypothetical protein